MFTLYTFFAFAVLGFILHCLVICNFNDFSFSSFGTFSLHKGHLYLFSGTTTPILTTFHSLRLQFLCDGNSTFRIMSKHLVHCFHISLSSHSVRRCSWSVAISITCWQSQTQSMGQSRQKCSSMPSLSSDESWTPQNWQTPLQNVRKRRENAK